jgi:hypothetical protein
MDGNLLKAATSLRLYMVHWPTGAWHHSAGERPWRINMQRETLKRKPFDA